MLQEPAHSPGPPSVTRRAIPSSQSHPALAPQPPPPHAPTIDESANTADSIPTTSPDSPPARTQAQTHRRPSSGAAAGNQGGRGRGQLREYGGQGFHGGGWGLARIAQFAREELSVSAGVLAAVIGTGDWRNGTRGLGGLDPDFAAFLGAVMVVHEADHRRLAIAPAMYCPAHPCPRRPNSQPAAHDPGAAIPASTAATLALVLAARSDRGRYQKARVSGIVDFAAQFAAQSRPTHRRRRLIGPPRCAIQAPVPQLPALFSASSEPTRGPISEPISARALFCRVSRRGNEFGPRAGARIDRPGQENPCVLQHAAPNASSTKCRGRQ